MTFRKNSRLKKTQGNFLKNSSLFLKNSRFCQLDLIIFAIQKIIALKWSNSSTQLLICKFVASFSRSLVKFLVHKLVHRISKPGKLKESSKNSRNSRKIQGFREKLKFFPLKTQDVADSTWFLLLKNVQKISLNVEQV